jgi:hypothetical protein
MLRAIAANLLTQLHVLQLPDHPWGQHKGDQERRHGRIDDPEAQIPEDVQERIFRMKRIQPVVEHAVCALKISLSA